MKGGSKRKRKRVEERKMREGKRRRGRGSRKRGGEGINRILASLNFVILLYTCIY